MEEFRECSSNKSSVWSHFLRSLKRQVAKCKHCQNVLTCSGGSTSTLRNHLKKKHNLILDTTGTDASASTSGSSSNVIDPPAPASSENPTEAEPIPKKRKMTDYYQNHSEQSMQMTVTRMVTLDGLTFRVFVNSVDLVRLFKNSGYTLPKSANTIRSLVMNEYEKAKIEISNTLMDLKKKGYKFSLTADEWSSTRNRRYLNINLHSIHFDTARKHLSLGLIRLIGSATAAKCTSVIEERLKLFQLNFEDIVGLTTDGASVMIKMGKDLPVHHQLCYAHALQLAVLDILYKSNDDFDDIVSQPHDLDDDGDSDSEDDGVAIIEPTARYARLQHARYKPLIDKVREVVKMFRKSPTKNDEFLQKYVLEDFGKDITLIIDCKTRWSSLCNMIDRFLMLYPSVQKALIDLKSKIHFNDDEIRSLKHVHEVLAIVKSVLEILCHENATLLTADTSLKHMFEKLKNISESDTDNLSLKLLEALEKRIGDRYILIQGVLKYLHSRKDFFDEPQSQIFGKPRPETISTIVAALGRDTAVSFEIQQTTLLTDVTDGTTPQSPPKLTFNTFKDELLHKLAADATPSTSTASTAASSSAEENCIPEMILFEMALHENGGQRGKFLTKAYQQLLSVKPTSVEAERAFSTAGYFCSKLRSRLNDSTLDALMFLRSYLLSQKINY